MSASTTIATPSAATLGHFLAALRNYEPDIADIITTTFATITPTYSPLLLLNSKRFKQLQATVKALPHGWRHRTSVTLCPSIGQRLDTIYKLIPRKLLTIIPQIITPQPHDRIRLMCRSRAPWQRDWDTRYRSVNPANYPLDVLHKHNTDREFCHAPLLYHSLTDYWERRHPTHKGKNYIQLFDASFPTDVGRLLYAVATYYTQYDDTIAHYHTALRNRILRNCCADYNRIKKAHVPEFRQQAKKQLAADRQWLALLGSK